MHSPVNDVRATYALLCERFSFERHSIYVLTDAPHGLGGVRTDVPTRRNIIKALDWLVGEAEHNDTLYFHFSGHSDQRYDMNRDEADGLDEAILPVDYPAEKGIDDDMLSHLLVRRVPRGATLFAVTDCSHSGTLLDLPYVDGRHDDEDDDDDLADASAVSVAAATAGTMVSALFGLGKSALKGDVQEMSRIGGEIVKVGKAQLKWWRSRTMRSKMSLPTKDFGRVLHVAACTDSEKAGVVMEASPVGALTMLMCSTLRGSRVYSYGGLMRILRDGVKKRGLDQVPQFSTSEPFDPRMGFVL